MWLSVMMPNFECIFSLISYTRVIYVKRDHSTLFCLIIDDTWSAIRNDLPHNKIAQYKTTLRAVKHSLGSVVASLPTFSLDLQSPPRRFLSVPSIPPIPECLTASFLRKPVANCHYLNGTRIPHGDPHSLIPVGIRKLLSTVLCIRKCGSKSTNAPQPSW